MVFAASVQFIKTYIMPTKWNTFHVATKYIENGEKITMEMDRVFAGK